MFHYKNITSKSAPASAPAAPGAKSAAAPAAPPRRRRRGRGFWLFVLLVVVAVAGWFVWHGLRQADAVAPPDTTAVARGDIQQTVLANGILQANSLVSVGAQVSGRIEKLDVAVGDLVKKGSLIAEIDPSDQQNAVKIAQAAQASVTAQLHSAQAAVKQAKAALDRSTTLNAKGLVAQSDQEIAEAALDTANAQVEGLQAQLQQANLAVDNANLNLSRTRITAPSDGTVVAVLVDEGQSVNAVQSSPTIVKLAELGTMVIKAQISEADVPRVKPGQGVYFTILGEPDNKISATLLSIDPAPDSIATDSDTTTPSTSAAIYYNGLFQVPNPDGKLRIDMTAQVTIVLAEAKDALLVPSSALTATPHGSFVTVYDAASGKTERRPVTVGIDNNVNAEITDGLAEGDEVVATGARFSRGAGRTGGGPAATTGAARGPASGAAGGGRRFGGGAGAGSLFGM